jgi:hypothetical protein
VLDAIAIARGTTYDPRALLSLSKKLCDQGDDSGCAYASIAEAWLDPARRNPGLRRSPQGKARIDAFDVVRERIENACDRGDARACATLERLNIDEDLSARHLRSDVACRAGFIAGCASIISEIWGCEDWGADDTCESILAWWRNEPGGDERLAVYQRLVARCDAGEADACEGLPGRALPRATLCAAHDYAACSWLACLGDDNAAEIARAHGALRLDDCQLAYNRALRAWIEVTAMSPRRSPRIRCN